MQLRLRTSFAIFLKASLLTFAVVTIVGPQPLKADDVEHTKDSLKKVKKLVDSKKAVLIDVREQREWDAGHVDGAMLIPLSVLSENNAESEFVQGLEKKLPKKYPLYVHCRSGGRCLIASEILEDLGYETRPLKPGYLQLIDAGFPQAKPEEND